MNRPVSAARFASFLAILICFGIATNLCAQPSPSAMLSPKRKEIKFTEYDLPNGLHVILHQDNRLPVVSTFIQYRVGSKDEQPDRTGFAHFFEHLMFEGSENILRGEINEFTLAAGGNSNAYTGYDQTCYHTTLPANQLKLALWIESERMSGARIDSAGVEAQRRVVKEERKFRYDNQPYGSLYEELVSMIFAGTSYAWVPIGSAQYIDQATLAEFMGFYKKFYVPNNAVLAIAGDFDSTKVKVWISDYFAAVPRGAEIVRPPLKTNVQAASQPSSQPVQPAPLQPIKIIVKPATPLPATIHAWRTVAQTERDGYALEMLANILAKGRSSRLYRRLVDSLQLALEVQALPFMLEKDGLFGVFVVGNRGASLAQLDSLLTAEMQLILEKGITDEELQKARNQEKSSQGSSGSTMLGRAQNLAHYYAIYGNTNLINTELEDYLRVTLEDIGRVVAGYLAANRKHVMHYTVNGGGK
ncbi:MAG: insulinase family protein [Rhizobacter sp.]|nr:insulinase family protein [Chlorobiales bacterium]